MRRKNCGHLQIKSREAGNVRREMTDSETRLWSRLRGNRLSGWHFRRQQVIRGFIVDFYCPEAKLAVEIDGGVPDAELDSDQMRDSILIAGGLTVLHLPVAMVERNMEDAVGAIEEKCRDRLSGCPATAVCLLRRDA